MQNIKILLKRPFVADHQLQAVQTNQITIIMNNLNFKTSLVSGSLKWLVETIPNINKGFVYILFTVFHTLFLHLIFSPKFNGLFQHRLYKNYSAFPGFYIRVNQNLNYSFLEFLAEISVFTLRLSAEEDSGRQRWLERQYVQSCF